MVLQSRMIFSFVPVKPPIKYDPLTFACPVVIHSEINPSLRPANPPISVVPMTLGSPEAKQLIITPISLFKPTMPPTRFVPVILELEIILQSIIIPLFKPAKPPISVIPLTSANSME